MGLCLTLALSMPISSYAATDTMTNHSVIIISDEKTATADSNSVLNHENHKGQYSKLNEKSSFAVSLLGTIILFAVFFILFWKRRRNQDEKE